MATINSEMSGWKKHPHGGEYADYKLGTISRHNGSYQVEYGYNTVLGASSLKEAKSHIDKYTKTKTMATKKIDTTAELRAEMKKNGVRLPHGYTVVKRKVRSVPKTKAVPKKRSTVAKKKTPAVKNKTATKSKAMTPAQKKFAFNAKRAALMVKNGHAKNLKDAWKQIKN